MVDRYNSWDTDWDEFYRTFQSGGQPIYRPSSPYSPPQMVPAVGAGGEPLGPAIQGQGDPYMRPMSVEQIYEGLPYRPPSSTGTNAFGYQPPPYRLTPEPGSGRIPPNLPNTGGWMVDPFTKELVKVPSSQTASNGAPMPLPANMRPRGKAPMPMPRPPWYNGPTPASPAMGGPLPAPRLYGRVPPSQMTNPTAADFPADPLTQMLVQQGNSPGTQFLGGINSGKRPILAAIMQRLAARRAPNAPGGQGLLGGLMGHMRSAARTNAGRQGLSAVPGVGDTRDRRRERRDLVDHYESMGMRPPGGWGGNRYQASDGTRRIDIPDPRSVGGWTNMSDSRRRR